VCPVGAPSITEWRRWVILNVTQSIPALDDLGLLLLVATMAVAGVIATWRRARK